MTQTGTIKFKDFGEEIAKSGIVSVVSDSSKLPMRERLVMLRKLGQGCSSIVYKALDITELRLVALKMVPFYEKEKRHQMVRELSALFQVLRRKQVDSKANIQCMHVALLFELKKANNRNNIVDFKSTRLGSTRVGSTRLGSDRLRSVSMRRGSATMNPKTFKIYPREYIVDFYDAFSDVEDGGVGMMMEYMDGGSLQVRIIMITTWLFWNILVY
jgi:serine/threonine protein kinase